MRAFIIKLAKISAFLFVGFFIILPLLSGNIFAKCIDLDGKEVPCPPPGTSTTSQQPPSTGTTSCTGFTDCLKGIAVPGLKAEFQPQGLVGTVITKIIPVALGIGGMLTVIFIIISGIQFITSGGDPKGAAAARSRLIYAVIGFIVLILAFAILQIIDKLFLRTGVA